MVNPLPTTADPQRYLEILEQFTQKWNEIGVRFESIISEQENAKRTSSRVLIEANTQNEAIPRIIQHYQLLGSDVRSMGAAINYSGNTNTSLNSIPNKSTTSQKEMTKSSNEELSAASSMLKEKFDVAAASMAKEVIKAVQMDLGCHFIPTDQELIACLVKKVTGGTVPKYIQERDLYGNEEPRDIFRNDPATELYFVTPIKTKFDSGKKVDRIVGNGTWKIQNNKDIFDDPEAKNTVIGCKRTLNYMENTKGKRDSWIMHEYILKDTQLQDQGKWAVCRVKRGRGNFTGLPVSLYSGLSPQTSLTSTAPTEFLYSLKRPVENESEAESNMPDNKKHVKASDGSLHLGLTL